MAVQFTADAEPIPGYKLLEPLGRGGFGEIWKAEAPGGLLKAIKVINGSLRSVHGEEVLVEQELQSLERVKGVRHPYVLSLDRFDIVDGRLIIVMELADKSLWDRFAHCQQEGLPGIRREELLRYIEEAAEALDVMSAQFGLQHSDIKPQNLFLVHNHLKVADFGLVRDLANAKVLDSGCFSPIYAAPETFEGRISNKSDQYSLGIVYQELLTGARPFDGKNARALLMQHMQAPPNLSSLPPGDQPVIGKALAKKPEDRYESCTELVKALRESTEPHKAAETIKVRKLTVANNPRPHPNTSINNRARPTGPLVASPGEVPPGYQRALSIACPGCGFRGQVPKEFIGKSAKCRACGIAFMVGPPVPPPAPTPPPPPPAPVQVALAVPVAPPVNIITIECSVCGHKGRYPANTSNGRFRCGNCGCVHRA